MIRRCPKCGEFTTGKADKLLCARISGKQNCHEIQVQGSKLGGDFQKWSKKKFGKILGNTVGAIGKGTLNATHAALGQGRSLVHSVASLVDSEDYYGFVCPNSSCKYEWIERKDLAIDKSDEFYEVRLAEFYEIKERKFLTIMPESSVAYLGSSNLFMFPRLPQSVQVLDQTLNPGEIYVSHPSNPNFFIPLETYRIKILEDELNDLKVFLQKLGAQSILITGMSDSELSSYNNDTISNQSKIGNKAASVDVNAEQNREDEEYKRIRTKFSSALKGERLSTIQVDTILFNRWRPIRPEWERIIELRNSGTTEYSFVVETETVSNASRMELDKLEAAYSELGTIAQNNYMKETISRLKESKKLKFTVNVVFYPKSQYENPQLIMPL